MTQQSPRFAKLRHFWHQPQEAKQLVLIEEQLAVGTTPRDHPQASKEGTEQSNHFERSLPRVRNKRPTISTNASPPIRATAGSVFEKAARRRHSTHQELENARRTLPQMESGEMLRVSCENLSLRSSQSVEGTPQREEKRPVANRIPGGERASKNDFPSSSPQEMEQLGNVGEERAGRFAVDKSWTRTFSEEESVGSAAELVPAGAANLEHEEEGEDGSDRDAVERLATRWRGFLARKEFLKKREATLTIQTLWRGHRQRQEFKKSFCSQGNLIKMKAPPSLPMRHLQKSKPRPPNQGRRRLPSRGHHRRLASNEIAEQPRIIELNEQCAELIRLLSEPENGMIDADQTDNTQGEIVVGVVGSSLENTRDQEKILARISTGGRRGGDRSETFSLTRSSPVVLQPQERKRSASISDILGEIPSNLMEEASICHPATIIEGDPSKSLSENILSLSQVLTRRPPTRKTCSMVFKQAENRNKKKAVQRPPEVSRSVVAMANQKLSTDPDSFVITGLKENLKRISDLQPSSPRHTH